MSDLPLPTCLEGKWEHALILTYGMDLPFFEQAILSELSARCRNRVILADGQHFLEACADLYRNGLARTFNHRYVAEGIYAPHAAHAKLILLTNTEQGRLLVGSGNLSWQGYASGGELFTQYEYCTDSHEHLAAFITVRELLQGLLLRGYISDAATRYVQLILSQTPWLYHAPPSPERPVRHNLQQSFIEQLTEELGTEPVEELIFLSPFYDEHCRALERMLDDLQPRLLRILVQRQSTSLDLTALQQVLNRFSGQAEVQPVRRANGDPYLHAKLIIIKQQQRAICLQGSPNLSQAALLLTDPHGNIELANLLQGERHSFDHLLTSLEVEPSVTQLSSLGTSYQPIILNDQDNRPTWHLTAASWNGTRLRIQYRGSQPNLTSATVLLGLQHFSVTSWLTNGQVIECTFAQDISTLLSRSVAVRIQLADSSETNPVFICNTVALDALLTMAIDDSGILSRIGGLDLDDQEMETLLGLLDDTLLLDQRSVWQTAGRRLSPADSTEDEALNLSYADINYALLRQHPRIQQYLRGLSNSHAGQTRLQVILNTISHHFLEILDQATQTTPSARKTTLIPTTDIREEELEDEDVEPVQRSRSQQQRTERLLRAFIRRYLQGVTSPDFRAFAGVEVMIQNYIIFSHILWRIWLKGWVDTEFLIPAMLTTWTSFWGDSENPSSFIDVDPAVRTQIDGLLRDHYTLSTLLAGLFDSAYRAQSENWVDLRIALRDFWRAFLTHHPKMINLEVLEETWYHLADVYPHDTPRPLDIIDELYQLASFETPTGFLRAIERRYKYPVKSCHIERVKVNRENIGTAFVECLIINSNDGLRSADEALSIIADWRQFKQLDYYRIVAPTIQGTQRVAIYEFPTGPKIFWIRQTNQEIELGEIVAEPPPWAVAIEHIRQQAARLKVTIQIPQLQTST